MSSVETKPGDMKRNDKFYFVMFILFIILGQTVAFSQVSVTDNQSKKFLITMKDGSTIQGTVVSESQQEIVMSTENFGIVTIKKDQIKSMILLESTNFKKGKYWFPNPNYSRYFISPGIQLNKGDGYYQNVDLSLNTVSYGITNFFSLGGGVELFSTLAGQPIFILTPKVGFKVSKSFWLGGGILYINSASYLADFGGLGIAYGSATYGNTNNNLTAGIGWGYFDHKWSEKPVITLSGMTRISQRFGLVTENWFVPNYSVFTYGVRFIGEKICVDIALVNSKDIAKEFALGMPIFLDFVYKF
jgi:hypothetical protein